MNRVDIDDFTHALGQTVAFFGKELDKGQVALWIRAFAGKDYPPIRNALLEYTRVGRYAPKPRDIYEIMDEQRATEAARLPPPQQQSCRCPPEIASAWMWFLATITKDSKTISGIFDSSLNIDIDQQEKYLHIVNHEAHRLSRPDAIPEEYKLQEVWGV